MTMVRYRRPFLKWAGGKYGILDTLLPNLPAGRRLVEPFVGSGAVFLNAQYEAYGLSDVNADLISLYQTLQREGEAFIRYAGQWFVPESNTRDAYTVYRERFNTTTEPREKAALFLYLNRHAYNGLCRYSQQGRFNVPFGRYRAPYFPAEEMRLFYRRSQRAVFQVADFETAMMRAEPGDVVYCDPPYAPLSATADFTAYAASAFGARQQQRLAELAQSLAERGIPVVISNHNTDQTREWYQAARRCVPFEVRRSISCHGDRRHTAPELLAVF